MMPALDDFASRFLAARANKLAALAAAAEADGDQELADLYIAEGHCQGSGSLIVSRSAELIALSGPIRGS